MELLGLVAGRLHQGLLVVLVGDVVECVSGEPEVVRGQLRQAMGTWVVEQRAAVGGDVFERHPHGAHEPGRQGAEVDRVGVAPLLGSPLKRKGLERDRLATLQIAKRLQNGVVDRDLLGRTLVLPHVLDTPVDACLLILEQAVELPRCTVDERLREGAGDDGVSVAPTVLRDLPLKVRAGTRRQLLLEEG